MKRTLDWVFGGNDADGTTANAPNDAAPVSTAGSNAEADDAASSSSADGAASTIVRRLYVTYDYRGGHEQEWYEFFAPKPVSDAVHAVLREEATRCNTMPLRRGRPPKWNGKDRRDPRSRVAHVLRNFCVELYDNDDERDADLTDDERRLYNRLVELGADDGYRWDMREAHKLYHMDVYNFETVTLIPR